MIDARMAWRLRQRGLTLPVDASKYSDVQLALVAKLQAYYMQKVDDMDELILHMKKVEEDENT